MWMSHRLGVGIVVALTGGGIITERGVFEWRLSRQWPFVWMGWTRNENGGA